MKKLPVGFFEEVRVQASSDEVDDDTPLELSEDVLSGKRSVKVYLHNKFDLSKVDSDFIEKSKEYFASEEFDEFRKKYSK